MRQKIVKKIICKNCLSESFRVEKWVFGKKRRLSFRAKFICLKCGKRFSYNLKKSVFRKKLYEITKQIIRWRKKGRKIYDKEGFDYIILNEPTMINGP